MSTGTISNLSIVYSLSSQLVKQQTDISKLALQLSSHEKNSDLTDYDPSDARNIISIQSAASEKQAYLKVISTASNNLSFYDATLTDLEDLVSSAQDLIGKNGAYSEDSARSVSVLATSYLKSVTADLNQLVNGRYLFSGTRFSTTPVQDLSQLPESTLSTTIETDGLTVPSYDIRSTISLSTSEQSVTVTGAANGLTGSQTASFDIDGTVYTVSIDSTDSTAEEVAADICAKLIAAGVSVSVDGSNPAQLNFDAALTIDSAQAITTDQTAYVTDKATIDTNYTVDYGVTSNDPSIQKLIAGLRYLQAAGNSTDKDTYTANLNQAIALLAPALTEIQNMHTLLANSINIMSNEKEAQNKAITNLTTSLSNVQGVDITQTSVEMTALETILQASYSVTGNILKMSIVSYL